jgi:hypothetical protein
VQVDGKVTGDIVAIFGNVRLRGDAQHDVVTIFGSTRAEKGSSIEGDLVSVFGDVHLGEDVVVAHDLVALFGAFHMAPTASIGGDRKVRSVWIVLAPLGLFLLMIFLVLREYRAFRHRLALRGYPPARRG